MSQRDETFEDYPRGVGNPARGASIAADDHRLSDLTAVSAADLLKLHGVGPKAIGVPRQALAQQGLAFAGKRPKGGAQ